MGDLDFSEVEKALNNNLGDIENTKAGEKTFSAPELKEAKTVEIIKDDAQQANYSRLDFPEFQKRRLSRTDTFEHNVRFCGLSSRLFLELREKRGLPITVRSNYETNEKCANFSIYIATEPKNVQSASTGSKQKLTNSKKSLFQKMNYKMRKTI